MGVPDFAGSVDDLDVHEHVRLARLVSGAVGPIAAPLHCPTVILPPAASLCPRTLRCAGVRDGTVGRTGLPGLGVTFVGIGS